MVYVYLFSVYAFFFAIPQFRGIESLMLIRYNAVLTASVQNCSGNLRVSACSGTLQNGLVHALDHPILMRIS